jgi:hypothetical protein
MLRFEYTNPPMVENPAESCTKPVHTAGAAGTPLVQPSYVPVAWTPIKVTGTVL